VRLTFYLFWENWHRASLGVGEKLYLLYFFFIVISADKKENGNNKIPTNHSSYSKYSSFTAF